MNQYIKKMGLEIHIQMNLNSKLFSASSTEYTLSPNKNLQFFDMGLPGTLPLLNEQALVKAINKKILEKA